MNIFTLILLNLLCFSPPPRPAPQTCTCNTNRFFLFLFYRMRWVLMFIVHHRIVHSSFCLRCSLWRPVPREWGLPDMFVRRARTNCSSFRFVLLFIVAPRTSREVETDMYMNELFIVPLLSLLPYVDLSHTVSTFLARRCMLISIPHGHYYTFPRSSLYADIYSTWSLYLLSVIFLFVPPCVDTLFHVVSSSHLFLVRRSLLASSLSVCLSVCLSLAVITS